MLIVLQSTPNDRRLPQNGAPNAELLVQNLGLYDSLSHLLTHSLHLTHTPTRRPRRSSSHLGHHLPRARERASEEGPRSREVAARGVQPRRRLLAPDVLDVLRAARVARVRRRGRGAPRRHRALVDYHHGRRDHAHPRLAAVV